MLVAVQQHDELEYSEFKVWRGARQVRRGHKLRVNEVLIVVYHKALSFCVPERLGAALLAINVEVSPECGECA